jgi:hypothetical protein
LPGWRQAPLPSARSYLHCGRRRTPTSVLMSPTMPVRPSASGPN